MNGGQRRQLGNSERDDSETSCKNFVPKWEACVEAIRPGVIVKWDSVFRKKIIIGS